MNRGFDGLVDVDVSVLVVGERSNTLASGGKQIASTSRIFGFQGLIATRTCPIIVVVHVDSWPLLNSFPTVEERGPLQ